MRLRRGRAHSEEAVSTVNGTTLSWFERDGGFNATQGTFNRDLYSLTWKRLSVSLHVCGDSLVLLSLAGLTTFRLVLESLICKELLLSGRENEFLTTIYTCQ
jgi:hypothetical protein